MYPSILFLSLAAISGTRAAALTPKDLCGAVAPSKKFLDAVKELHKAEAEAFKLKSRQNSQVQVKTYVHIVATDQTFQGGYVSRDLVNKQMEVLNKTFAPSGFSFILQDVDWTVGAQYDYIQQRSQIETSMKQALRKGDYQDLNLYYLPRTYTGVSGWCNYPLSVTKGDANFLDDGCTLDSGTMPGGDFVPFNEGKITTHETGHWLGLIHTFEGSCNDGDYISDTPAEFGPSSGCYIGQDTCPGPGVDPIHNYMDYTDNACVTEFTPGQITRMWSMWNQYRSGR